ncbi:FGGY-family carbohydrate kinase [Ruficoccus amylovorans]|uniref:FGGY-family carbohydrate kinase n=1 Tax=Ruficoccus amylovorans TaxID=1804625 RepID=A0A842HAS9_9BACT|nr:FGGY-family carbohydrate kinase [Ruficoccus amylovorans]MBC2593390.1 FGGY-family carbohydrate kinase [Ruficoccus amylovorans]
MKTPSPLFLGIDVGTGSARAGLFTASGEMLATAKQDIPMWKPKTDFVEQSSEAIWQACCNSTRAALKAAKAKPEQIAGIGFDATCSLVAVDAAGAPVSLSPSGSDEQNVIVWMDHRAISQAERINSGKHKVLRYVGGVISPEMQTPKLLWVKENMPKAWKRTAHFFDLPDYLTYRATGDTTRSLCSLVCKWTYLGHQGLDGAGWDKSYFESIGLGDFVQEGFARIGTRVRPMGEPVGSGLTAQAAKDLGLAEGTPVGVSIIDAHAGGLGLLGASLGKQKVGSATLNKRIALIGGTSSCHMAASPEPRYIKGVWGPYFSAMIPGLWLTEGGQSATGALLDHVIFNHPAAAGLQAEAEMKGTSIFDLLNDHIDALAKSEGLKFPAALTRELHIQPDFHGNRSPRANPTLKGMVSGLTLSATRDDLARQYLAAIQAVAYGTRHILDELNKKGYDIKTIFICGGGTKNRVFMREHADITGCTLVLPQEPEAVLLGGAVLGSVAAGANDSVLAAMNAMNVAGKTIEPARGATARYHDAKYAVFHRMHKDFLAYRKLMSES